MNYLALADCLFGNNNPRKQTVPATPIRQPEFPDTINLLNKRQQQQNIHGEKNPAIDLLGTDQQSENKENTDDNQTLDPFVEKLEEMNNWLF